MSNNSQSHISETSKRHQFYKLRQALRKVRNHNTAKFGAFEYGVLYALSDKRIANITMFEFLNLIDSVKYSLEPAESETRVSRFVRAKIIRNRISYLCN